MTELLQTLTTSKRQRANVNAYVVLRQDEQVLLGLRQNTGYLDNQWGLVAGHVEDGEPASLGLIREAYEEAGIVLLQNDLRAVHVLHRKTDRQNVDVFFECEKWQGSITNCEPEKCAALQFFPLLALPPNTVYYITEALRHIQHGTFYSEIGWGQEN